MNLIEIRKRNGLTQKEAAAMLGIPYRTYIRYEENEKYADSYKYKMITEKLFDLLKIDEEHGILSLDKIKELLLPILKSKIRNFPLCTPITL